MNIIYKNNRRLIAWLLCVAVILGCIGGGEVRAEGKEHQVTYTVTIEELQAPIAGSVITTAGAITTQSGITVTIATSCALYVDGSDHVCAEPATISPELYAVDLNWYESNDEGYCQIASDEIGKKKFATDKSYKMEMIISPKTDNLFADFDANTANQVNITYKEEGFKGERTVDITKNADGNLVITIEYPTEAPTATPIATPTATPTVKPTATASTNPTEAPTGTPSTTPSDNPSGQPTTIPSVSPIPTTHPTTAPSATPIPPTLACKSSIETIQVVKQNSTVKLSVTTMLDAVDKEKYTYSYEWKWAGTKQSSQNNTCVVKAKKKGIYEWSCTVTATNQTGSQKATDIVTGVVYAFQPSGGEVVLTKSLKAQNLCNNVFGVKPGAKIAITKLAAQGKKEKKCWKVAKNKITAKKYLASGKVKMQMKFQYGSKSLTKTIQVTLRTGLPAGKVTFTLKNGGKKITCKYSKEIVNIVKNRKKYGIKDVDVAMRYSMDGKSYKPVPGLVKGYLNVKRLNKKCFITTAGKYRIKKFKVTLLYKVSGKTQKKAMKVINHLAK